MSARKGLLFLLGVFLFTSIFFQNCSNRSFDVAENEKGGNAIQFPVVVVDDDKRLPASTNQGTNIPDPDTPIPVLPITNSGSDDQGSIESSAGSTSNDSSIKPHHYGGEDTFNETKIRSAGYNIVTGFDGKRVYIEGKGNVELVVDKTGVRDSFWGIQYAMEQSYKENKPLYFPSGTYLVSDTLRAYNYTLTGGNQKDSGRPECNNVNIANPPESAFVLVGNSINRPTLKLTANNSKFGVGSFSKARPIIAFRHYRANSAAATKRPNIADLLNRDPMDDLKPDFCTMEPDHFKDEFRNFHLDVNKNPGGIGINFPAAQETGIENVSVNARGGFAGFAGLPSVGFGALNISVDGGQYGIITVSEIDGRKIGGGDPTIVGLRLKDQTVSHFFHGDMSPITVIGFQIESNLPTIIKTGARDSSGNVLGWAMGGGTYSLIDGEIVTKNSNSYLLDVSTNKNVFLRNVYFKGSQKIIRDGEAINKTSLSAKTLIQSLQYAAKKGLDSNFFKGGWTSQKSQNTGVATYQEFARRFDSRNFIDGVLSKGENNALPIYSVTSYNEAPSDLLSRHLPKIIHSIDNGDFVSVTDEGAKKSGLIDSKISNAKSIGENILTAQNASYVASSAIEAAIKRAKQEGHNRVFLPRGLYFIDRPIQLDHDTQLFGISRVHSMIVPSFTWGWNKDHSKNEKSPALIVSKDSAQSTAYVGHMTLLNPDYVHLKNNNYYKQNGGAGREFSYIKWMAGINSHIFAVKFRSDYPYYAKDSTRENKYKTVIDLSKNAGGRHYFLSYHNGWGMNHKDARFIRINSTNQALWLYGVNGEMTKNAPYANAVIEINNAKNIYLFSLKREGSSPTALVTSSENVSFVSSSAMREGMSCYVSNNGNCLYQAWLIFKDSNNVEASNIIPQGFSNKIRQNSKMIIEDYNGQVSSEIDHPHSIGVFSRGTFDHSKMYIKNK